MDHPAAFIGRSRPIVDLLGRIERAAAVDVPVLFTGETGTGKSHLARLLHAKSKRAARPLVAANCAAIADSLFESEMFGHVRGAFTGAIESRVGLFEEASGGTLFLDEIGELPLSQQAKLLTVIEEQHLRPVGATRSRSVNVRIVSATARDLAAETAAGGFRADLYHRVALIRCEIPPLRERPEDLREIATHLLRGLSRKYKVAGLELSTEAWGFVVEHRWPGNVRELAHVLEAAAVMASGRVLSALDVSRAIESSGTIGSVAVAPTDRPSPVAPRAQRSRQGRYSFFGSQDQERDAIRKALADAHGNRSAAARVLGMSRNTLTVRIRRYGLTAELTVPG